MTSKTFKDLIVWEKAHQWVLEIYGFTESFPKKEQIRVNISIATGSNFDTS